MRLICSSVTSSGLEKKFVLRFGTLPQSVIPRKVVTRLLEGSPEVAVGGYLRSAKHGGQKFELTVTAVVTETVYKASLARACTARKCEHVILASR